MLVLADLAEACVALARVHAFRGAAQGVPNGKPKHHAFNPREVRCGGRGRWGSTQELRIAYTDVSCAQQCLKSFEIGHHIPKRIASQGRSGEVKWPYRAS